MANTDVTTRVSFQADQVEETPAVSSDMPSAVTDVPVLNFLLFAAVRKNSSKLTFSRSTEVLTVALATSELKACAGGILLRGIILHWQRCSLRVLV